MRVLDLFCGAGGAARGYQEAGFYVVGVDIDPQPNYCGDEFIQMDALGWIDFAGFDLIHASPPCQRFSTITPDPGSHPDHIGSVRNLVDGIPIVIENVPAAPLRRDLMLCGSTFGLQVQRHRVFEIGGFTVPQPSCNHVWNRGRPWTVTGELRDYEQDYPHSLKPSLEGAKELLGVPWMVGVKEVVESIPPAYTKFIGEAFLAS